ncbi:MAG: GNAT family acetyltransferase [Armatimonadota bacterium]|nr:MAG: GNAT family acetyltransferase [Armatimonadota bacterium]
MSDCEAGGTKRGPDVIKGERVLLRPLRESDLEESLRVWTPELRHMYGGSLTSPRRPTMEDRRRWFERVQRGEQGHFHAVEADGRYIGHATVEMTDEGSRRARFRIGIDNPDYWGKGYGTEVTRLMLRLAFEEMDCHRVAVRVAAYNARAIRCYEKCGFRHEGVERESFFADEEWHDDVMMAMLRGDWQELQEAALGTGSVRIRAFTIADYEQVAALWHAAGLGPRPADARDEVAKKLRRDPDLFLVACAGERIVGTVIGGWDGRRGWAYRMAMHPDYQRRGLGRVLMRELEERLVGKGAISINVIYNTDNERARAFYHSLGYEDRREVSVMGKAL